MVKDVLPEMEKEKENDKNGERKERESSYKLARKVGESERGIITVRERWRERERHVDHTNTRTQAQT